MVLARLLFPKVFQGSRRGKKKTGGTVQEKVKRRANFHLVHVIFQAFPERIFRAVGRKETRSSKFIAEGYFSYNNDRIEA